VRIQRRDAAEMRAIPAEADSQCGVFTVGQALAAGWRRPALTRAVDSGHLMRPRTGAYALSSASLGLFERQAADRDFLLAGVASALRVARSTVSHASAAAVHGLPLLSLPPVPCLTLPPERRTREAGLHVHRQPISDAERQSFGSIPVTRVARTCLDVTRESGLRAGLVTTDAALRRGVLTPQELRAAYAALRGRAGLSDGDALVRLADGRSESPLESVSRFAMRALEPQPELQVCLLDALGRFIARVDFFWREFGLVGEADGMGKYDEAELRHEKRRSDALVNAGFHVTRWGWSTAMNPPQLQRQIQQALQRCATQPSVIVRPGVSARQR
jgi:hypothetical protein